jgi:hypothetical protein
LLFEQTEQFLRHDHVTHPDRPHDQRLALSRHAKSRDAAGNAIVTDSLMVF